jgi:hypothetical protein
MKQFELRLVQRDGPKIIFHEIIEGDSLTELLSKLLLTIVDLQNIIHEKDLKEQLGLHGINDDIPF